MNINQFQFYIGMVNSYYRRAYKKFLKKEAPYYKLNGRRVLRNPEQVNSLLSERILSNKPFMAARFGSTELSVINEYYEKNVGIRKQYTGKTLHTLCFNAGFFPQGEEYADKFAELMLSECSDLDIIGLWNDRQELFTIKGFAPNALGVKLYCLEPYYDLESSWTHALKGKKVLVVHPFSETIQSQFLHKERLFDKDFWPECELITYKAIQTIAGEKDDRFCDWFSALSFMKEEIEKIDFDIAILGCGAYGFPLAGFIKKMGKQAIHLGGATQVLFGIRANRWENSELSKFFNDYWVRPSDDETPQNANKIENGCYW